MAGSGWLDSLKAAFTGGKSELGREDLLVRICDALDAMKHHGQRGETRLPPAVNVRISVAEGSVEVLRLMVEDPSFDKELRDRLLNRYHRIKIDALPLVRCTVVAGPINGVEVRESNDLRALMLCIEGGDRDGELLSLKADRRTFHLGRGPWHDEDRISNDLVVSEADAFISRRAARLHRSGPFFEIEAVDQDDCLFVMRPNGDRIRPARTVEQRLQVRPGDIVELTDGGNELIRLHLMEQVPDKNTTQDPGKH